MDALGRPISFDRGDKTVAGSMLDEYAYNMHHARMDAPVDIEFDPDKAAANLRKHKVSFSDAEQALRDPMG
ncbi:MAG: BrnT family toxin, partial [Anaerolineae bacterium]|nr:BrnT family toxin [Anaerolineae bacterium]